MRNQPTRSFLVSSHLCFGVIGGGIEPGKAVEAKGAGQACRRASALCQVGGGSHQEIGVRVQWLLTVVAQVSTSQTWSPI